MKLKFSSFLVFLLFFIVSASSGQMKVVIMGSSTAYGTGASVYDSSWAGRTTALLNRNITDGMDTVFYNIAAPGYDTYQEMPSDFIPPAGRPLPDDGFNVTKALSYNPDIVIISLPSNDINYGYAKSEMIGNLRVMFSTIFAAGTRCYITTPQPRNDLDQGKRDSLLSLVDSVNMSFGPYALDFWDGLVTTDGLNMLKDEYRAIPSLLHLNDDGHNLLFQRVRDSYIFGLTGPVALRLTAFNAQVQNRTVLISWHTEQQDANTDFELQRSADGRNFETIFTQNITEPRQSYNYSDVDQTPLTGKSFYRLKITEGASRITYSATVAVTIGSKALDISKLYMNNGGSTLNVEISLQKSQVVFAEIITSTGAVMLKQKQFINQPGDRLTIPAGELAAGQYFMRVLTESGISEVKAFRK